jgi:predicted transcriptional regulator
MARRTRQSPLPPPLEMTCLAALWAMKEGTVREVVAALAVRQPFAYTTVMTLLERLVRRGQLTRRKAGRSFIYTPAQDPEELRERALEEFVRNYFAGSREALRTWLDSASPVQPVQELAASESIDTALL